MGRWREGGAQGDIGEGGRGDCSPKEKSADWEAERRKGG